MIKVGLTGGIGSGKTYISKIFEKLGVPVFSADNVAKKIVNTDYQIKKELIKNFGSDIYLENGSIHRKKLANIIFQNDIALQKINSIIHPVVRSEFDKWAKQQTSNYVIQEAAILFENNQNYLFDKMITVTAPMQTKIARVMVRDKISANMVKQRMKKQLEDEIKIAKSDYIIINNGIEMIIPQIVRIHNKLK